MLIGDNYPGEPRALAAVFMILPCIGMTLLFGAFTERAGGNPIPAAVAHAVINSTTSVVFMLVSVLVTAAAVNHYLDTPLGIVAALVMFLAGLLIIRTSVRHGRNGPDAPTPVSARNDGGHLPATMG